MTLKKISYSAFSLLFALSLTVGSRVYKTSKITFKGFSDIIVFILLTLIISLASYMIIWGMGKLKDKFSNKWQKKVAGSRLLTSLLQPFKSDKPWVQLLVFAAILFICWLPCFLSYYPMMDAYDIFYKTPYWFQQHSQAVTGNYIKHHSVLHTFFWSLAVKTGTGLNVSPFVPYALGQMIVMAVIFAKSIVFLNKKGIGKVWTLFALLFYAIPVNAIFTQIPTKDVSMAPLLLLLTMNLYCLFNKEAGYKKRFGIPMAILEALLCCLLRNNFIYAFIVFAVIGLIVLKKSRKDLMIFSLITILSFALINGPVYKALGVFPGEKHEALCLPIQQLSYTLIEAGDKLSETQINEITMYFPQYEKYNPRFADPVKDNTNDEILESNLGNFLKLWIKVGLKCPKEYIDSFLNLNIPYWYLMANPIDPYSEREYIETGSYEDHTPLLSHSLLDFYEKEGDFKGINSLPVIRILFLLATPMWLLFFGICKNISERKPARIMVLSLLLLYMLTFLLGPVSCMRYIYPIFVTYPVLFFMIF